MSKQSPLPEVPFDAFPDYDSIAAFCRDLSAARPGLCEVSSLGPSRDGRDVLLLTITDHARGAAGDKPSYLIHAAIHGAELAGIPLALYNARQLLADHAAGSELLARVTFYIVPVLNPNGANLVATLSMPLRSRWDRTEQHPNTLYSADVNGDNQVVQMRQEHPDGDHMRDPEEPRLVVPRKAGGAGPFYRVWTEGFIHDFDGNVHAIRREHRSLDWNRQWACNWEPEHVQAGAGDFPFSEPEMHHLARFIHDRPNLAGALGYHTGMSAVLRPPSSGSVRDMDAGDHQLYNEIGRVGADATGWPLVPIIDYHRAYMPPNNLRGHFGDFGYYHLGLFVFEFELGTIFDSAGYDMHKQLDLASEDERIDLLRGVLKWWDSQPDAEREPLWVDWQPFDHPQLGKVELGGFLARHQVNRTLRELREIAPRTHAFCVHHAGCAPQLVAEEIVVDDLGEGLRRIRVTLANRGRLPTNITNKGRSIKRLRTVRATLQPGEGVTLLSRRAHHDAGHLEGPTGIADLEWFVRLPPPPEARAAAGAALGRVEVQAGAAGNFSVTVRDTK